MTFLFDFLPILLFFIAFKLHGIFAATAVAMAASVVQIGWAWLRHRRVERMPLITLILVVALGAATLILQDEQLIKWKPTVVNWLFAVTFLGSHFIGQKTLVERMMGQSMALPKPVWTRLSLAWIVFFAAIGVLNLYVAFNFDTPTWVDFKLFGMLGLTLAFVVAQTFYLAYHLKTEIKTTED